MSLAASNQESIFEYSFDDPKKMERLMSSKGIFSFGLFRNYQDTNFASLAYLFQEGISKYIELTKREQFKDWVVLVYIDESLFNFSDLDDPTFIEKEGRKTINYIYNDGSFDFRFPKPFESDKPDVKNQKMKLRKAQFKKYEDIFKKDTVELIVKYTKELLQSLQQESNCILCKYTFPQFLIPGTPFHSNFIGSMARFHALLKFNDRRVCVRDADTYFPRIWHYREDKDNSRYSTREPFMSIAKNYVEYLEAWELNLLQYHRSKNLPFLIAYDHPYVFHNFRQKPIIQTTRLLAGIVDSEPHDPALFTTEDWNKAMAFINEDSTKYNIRGSKNVEYTTKNVYVETSQANFKKGVDANGTTYYGCDEKVLRYIFFEKWRGLTVLFYFPYAYMGSNLMYSDPNDKESFLNKYEKILNEETPKTLKESPLFKGVEEYINHYKTMTSYDKYYIKTPPGQFYFLFQSYFPFFSEKLALEIYGKVPDNIKGGNRKSLKHRKVKKGRKSKFLGKSRKNR